MKSESVGKEHIARNCNDEAFQLLLIVENCKVVLNFPPKSEGSIVNDIKQMMLGGAVKV